MITVSVPGKVHLMGEHAVVYGRPALLAAINLRLTVSLESSQDGNKIVPALATPYVKPILEIVRKHLHLQSLPAMKIKIKSEIPIGYHLGSSAAAAVATSAACLYFLRKTWDMPLVNQLAYEAEKIYHGNPSGGDNTAVTYGGFLWYRKELEFIKGMVQLAFKLPTKLNHFYLIDTGKPAETTREMVELVKSKMQSASWRTKMEESMNQNEIQTKRLVTAIKENNGKEIVDAINLGERTLEAMGVVSQKAISLIRSLEADGAAVKILGGGGLAAGVGFLLCYQPKEDKLKSFCQNRKRDFFAIELGAEGARLEKYD